MASTKRRGFVITVTSPSGGTGKSSLTLNLASHLGLRLKKRGMTVCVVDANFQQADTGKYLNVYNPNITNIVQDREAFEKNGVEQFLVHRPELGISALLGPATPTDASPTYLHSRLYNEVLQELKKSYDYVIVDTPAAEKYHDIFTGFALPQADFIVVPVVPSIPALMNADAWLRSITSSRETGGDGIDPYKVGIVLNRTKTDVGSSEEEVRQDLSQWNFLGSIPESSAWQEANNRFEVLAASGLKDLNESLGRILYRATREPVLGE